MWRAGIHADNPDNIEYAMIIVMMMIVIINHEKLLALIFSSWYIKDWV